MNIIEEKLSDVFTKYRIQIEEGLEVCIHKFTGIDEGEPHDHPYSFTSKVLKGIYIEKVFIPNLDFTTWIERTVERKVGDIFHVNAIHIHKIIDLPNGECITCVFPEKNERECGFWKFDENGCHFRKWNEDYK